MDDPLIFFVMVFWSRKKKRGKIITKLLWLPKFSNDFTPLFSTSLDHNQVPGQY